jgi:putative ribosome biogenesis GTPase RsgA
VKKFFPSKAEVKQLFVKSGLTGVQRKMKSDLDAWKKVTINLAILGQSGVGKSSFINAIRG